MTRVELSDGVGLAVEELGEGLPLIVLHGGPGLDHTMFRPYLDPLAEDVRLIYVDQRGQGRSDRVDPQSLSLEVFARDVDLLAEALGLERFALLGHSFGAIVATFHAIELGTAERYVISGGGDSDAALMADVEASLDALGEQGKAFVPDLRRIDRPVLVVVGAEDRTTTPRAARVLAGGIPGSELVVLDGAGHMSFVEAQEAYLAAVQAFLNG